MTLCQTMEAIKSGQPTQVTAFSENSQVKSSHFQSIHVKTELREFLTSQKLTHGMQYIAVCYPQNSNKDIFSITMKSQVSWRKFCGVLVCTKILTDRRLAHTSCSSAIKRNRYQPKLKARFRLQMPKTCVGPFTNNYRFFSSLC